MSNVYFQPRKVIRVQGYDYSQNGMYFVTICVWNRKQVFGSIVQEEMCLSEQGKIAASIWNTLPQRFPCLGIDEFIVMPNHVHGILVIDNPDAGLAGGNPGSPVLWEVVRAFKSVTSRTIRTTLHQPDFKWQSRFYDHIIRKEIVLNRIRRYIVENPIRWSRKTNLCWLT